MTAERRVGSDSGARALARRRLRRLLGRFPRQRFCITEQRPIPGIAGWRAERLQLAGPEGPVRAFLSGPAGPWRALPAVLYIHAHGNRHAIGADELIHGRPMLRDPPYAQALASIGVVALCIDLPCFGERAGETESLVAKRHLWQGRTLFGAMLAELSAACALLRRIDGVNPNRIGVMGASMGATLSFWLAALEPRLCAAAHLCCFADLTTLVTNGAHDLHGVYMTVPGLLPAFRTGEIAGLVAPRPQLIALGAADPLTPPDAVAVAVADTRSAYAAADAADRLTVLIEPNGGHAETKAMRTALLAFLRENLCAG